ncbi:hypothetical protein DFH09DRAFT_1344042 [Mycena vulgaris]|nr:hypothetical protein DFH09DRAFT_1344042 [Mycena vulgaris]
MTNNLWLVIETEIPQYLNLAKPLDEQDDANIDTLIKSICEARTSMRKYHDAWPVFVHMKPFLSVQGAVLPGNPMESQCNMPVSPILLP